MKCRCKHYKNCSEYTAIERFNAPTPKFFKKIRKWGLTLTAISAVFIAANGTFNLGLPLVIDTIGQWLGFGGFIAATISSFAVDQDKEESS